MYLDCDVINLKIYWNEWDLLDPINQIKQLIQYNVILETVVDA